LVSWRGERGDTAQIDEIRPEIIFRKLPQIQNEICIGRGRQRKIYEK
jgi:hypothetical protein